MERQLVVRQQLVRELLERQLLVWFELVRELVVRQQLVRQLLVGFQLVGLELVGFQLERALVVRQQLVDGELELAGDTRSVKRGRGRSQDRPLSRVARPEPEPGGRGWPTPNRDTNAVPEGNE